MLLAQHGGYRLGFLGLAFLTVVVGSIGRLGLTCSNGGNEGCHVYSATTSSML